MDNTKILSLCGLEQKDLMPLFDGLKYEIGRCADTAHIRLNEAIDGYLAKHQF